MPSAKMALILRFCQAPEKGNKNKDYSAANNLEENFLDGAQFRKCIDSRREEFRAFLTHVGLLKKQAVARLPYT